MRIFANPFDAVREVERDLGEMGVMVWPHSMQDKNVKDDENYSTKEIRAYGFQISNWEYDAGEIYRLICYMFPDEIESVRDYIYQEHLDRVGGQPLNPGNAYQYRLGVWEEFLHNNHFAYTYAERFALQLYKIKNELHQNPDSRQCIINMHTNICPMNNGDLQQSNDLINMGGKGRIPCSMYYQFMVREERLDLIYTMRSCDFFTHFGIDITLALKLQKHMAEYLDRSVGMFTYFTGSLHAYKKDIDKRDIF